MVVGIVGSREYKDLARVREFVFTLPEDTLVVSGGARGVDSVAVDAANERRLFTKVFPVHSFEWNLLGKRAGHIRNATLVEYLYQTRGTLVAFMNEVTPGTQSAIRMAQNKGIKVVLNPILEK